LNAVYTEPARFVTLAHELAHIYCGHFGGHPRKRWPRRSHLPLGRQAGARPDGAWWWATRVGNVRTRNGRSPSRRRAVRRRRARAFLVASFAAGAVAVPHNCPTRYGWRQAGLTRTFRRRAAAHGFPPFDPVRDPGTRTDQRAFRTGVLIATFRCAAPACCGAFTDERRVVAATRPS